ncbi:MAG: hypothetical protein ACRDY7_00240 [Acidimicrobiia bacterium]
MPEPEDGTSDFRVGGLKDLIESQEAPEKGAGGGGGKNRQLAIIGGAVAVVVVILAVVLLAGGGGGDGGGEQAEGTRISVEMKSSAVNVNPGERASICDTAAGPVAENVFVSDVKSGKTVLGGETLVLTVLAEGEDLNDLGRKPESTWRALGVESCPAVETEEQTPATTEATAPTVGTSPPDSAPTPPPPPG